MASLEELKAEVQAGYVCEYCGLAGVLYETLEIRPTRKGPVYACKNVAACDARWSAQNPEDEI